MSYSNIEDPSLRSCAAQECVGSEKFGPDDQRTFGTDDGRTDGELSTPETVLELLWQVIEPSITLLSICANESS